MIHFLVGKPRNGKSLRAMMHIIEQLTTTERTIVTNMVIDVGALQEVLDERGHNVHVIERVFMLNDAETRDFWLHRGHGYVLGTPTDYSAKTGGNVDYSPMFEDARWRSGGKLTRDDGMPAHLKGTAFFIDECHTIWPARGWQGTPRHADFYNSQHGKLNDEVWFITQNLKLVDPNFYRLAQDFTYCRNHRLEKHGLFRGDNKFVAKTYQTPPATTAEPTLNVFTFALDLKVANCYDTSAGVGMPGGGTADAGHRAKGIPLKTVWIGLAVAIALVWVVMRYGVPMLSNQFVAPAVDPAGAHRTRTRPPGQEGRNYQPGFMGNGGANTLPFPSGSGGLRGGAPSEPEAKSSSREVRSSPFLEAVLYVGGFPRAVLEDGSVLEAGDIREVHGSSIVDRVGVVYRFRTKQEIAARLSGRIDQANTVNAAVANYYKVPEVRAAPVVLPPSPVVDDRAPEQVRVRTVEEIAGKVGAGAEPPAATVAAAEPPKPSATERLSPRTLSPRPSARAAN